MTMDRAGAREGDREGQVETTSSSPLVKRERGQARPGRGIACSRQAEAGRCAAWRVLESADSFIRSVDSVARLVCSVTNSTAASDSIAYSQVRIIPEPSSISRSFSASSRGLPASSQSVPVSSRSFPASFAPFPHCPAAVQDRLLAAASARWHWHGKSERASGDPMTFQMARLRSRRSSDTPAPDDRVPPVARR
jgi:hypothetical protein